MIPGVPTPQCPFAIATRCPGSARPQSVPGVPNPTLSGVLNRRVSLEGRDVRSKVICSLLALGCHFSYFLGSALTLHDIERNSKVDLENRMLSKRSLEAT